MTDIKLTALLDNIVDLPDSVITDRVINIMQECGRASCPPPPKRKRSTRYRWSASFKPLAENVINVYRDLQNAKRLNAPCHSLTASLKTAKKILRKAQRQAAARRRRDKTEAIINACHRNNKDDFFRLIRQQRSSSKKPAHVDFEKHTTDNEADSWAQYFENLATPQDSDTFDQDYKKFLRINYLLQYLNASRNPLPPVTESDVNKLIMLLKAGKAPDIFGISSEHIKLASPKIIKILTLLTNNALTTVRLPDSYKLGSVCPVLKKTKPPKSTNSYRRITITSIVGKVVEIHMINEAKPPLNNRQSHHQFGFTCGTSPIYAALTLTEILAEATDSRDPLYITLLDTSKAFDVVDHEGMLNALHQHGISGQMWRLFDSLYSNIQSCVKWNGELSTSFQEKQGIRQGGSSSADIYKAGKNKLLRTLDNVPSNKIGHINTGSLMVADDLALTAHNQYDMQTGLLIAQHDASSERYKFNVDKTKVILINTTRSPDLLLNNKTLGTSPSEPHLGIHRNSKNNNSDTIESRLKSGRRACYSLFGAGFFGLNGVGPYVAAQEYQTYVSPILFYGLEALVLSTSEINKLELFHRKNIRRIQFLPDSTAISALYLLLGTLPAEAILHSRALNLLRNILAVDTPSPPALYMRELIIRQLAMKGPKSSSWAAMVKEALNKYDLPPASSLIDNPPPKQTWKRTVKLAVNTTWQLREDAQAKSSLYHLKIQSCSTHQIHPVWQNLHSPLEIMKATVKAQLLIQRYPLTTNRTAGSRRADICPLCKEEPETVSHFLLVCPALHSDRLPYLMRILNICREKKISIDPDSLTNIILDSNHLPEDDIPHEALCRNMIFKLHSLRSIKLGGVSKYKHIKWN